MAQRVITELIDDLDGTPAAATVPFGLDGVNYEIDLSEGHADDLQGVLGRYAQAGRKVGKLTGAPKATGRSTAGRYESKAIREWAKRNDVNVGDRGRISNIVKIAYRENKPELAWPATG